jgi:hypothetical protein
MVMLTMMMIMRMMMRMRIIMTMMTCCLRIRWSVTGTPLGKGKVEDLHALLQFLGARPYRDVRWWRHMLTNAGNTGREAVSW